ncbi:MAG: hypothetical protein D6835_04375, partial [Candidatus Thermofonsia bacterium]
IFMPDSLGEHVGREEEGFFIKVATCYKSIKFTKHEPAEKARMNTASAAFPAFLCALLPIQ